jgi:hypothetical protein
VYQLVINKFTHIIDLGNAPVQTDHLPWRYSDPFELRIELISLADHKIGEVWVRLDLAGLRRAMHHAASTAVEGRLPQEFYLHSRFWQFFLKERLLGLCRIHLVLDLWFGKSQPRERLLNWGL